ncbi:hypothetical protein SAMN03159495_0924 [Pseudomonas sp. NFR16]|nr:hypothetical protein SAMN03159495_0924 [Pseudomonas sp. NFR16]
MGVRPLAKTEFQLNIRRMYRPLRELAREGLMHYQQERGLSGDRRRSRRRTWAGGLPDVLRHPILLPLRASSRGKPRSYRGFVALPGLCRAQICGSGLARRLVHYQQERGLSGDRRRSRRKTWAGGLPDIPRHPILLPLRANSRGKPRSYKGLVAFPGFGTRARTLWELARRRISSR